jgi:hypothetical protein
MTDTTTGATTDEAKRLWALLDEIKRTIVQREEGRGTD